MRIPTTNTLFVCFGLLHAAGAVPAPILDPDTFLEKFGYLPRLTGPDGTQHSDEARREAVRTFQRFVGLGVTGVLDDATRAKMRQPRCGVPDVHPREDERDSQSTTRRRARMRGPQGFFLNGAKWNRKHLTWRSVNYSPDMPWGSQRLAFYKAFQYWSDVTPLEFREVGGGKPDIEIKFGYYHHGDDYPFDGKGGTLAHAFFPEDGRTHFDEAEKWTEDSTRGTNLRIVATHEFGHALGLEHSSHPDALMAPYYSGYVDNFQLHNDDINGIQRLYGPRRSPPSRPQPTPPPRRRTSPRVRTQPPQTTRDTSDTRPDRCTTKFDAILLGYNSKTYVFRGEWVWQLNVDVRAAPFIQRVQNVFPKAPTNVGGAVHSKRTGRTYLFKGNRIWRYYKNRIDVGFPKRINHGFPKRVDAAVSTKLGEIYLFSGDRSYLFNEYTQSTVNTDLIRRAWPGVPSNVEAAVESKDGYLYFFKGSNYRKFNEKTGKVVPGYPKPKAPSWMACGTFTPKLL